MHKPVSSRWDTGKVASGIMVALIALAGTVLGALGAILGSVMTPWVNWGIEKRRRTQDARVELITQWRGTIRELRNAEKGHLAQNAEHQNRGEPELPDPPEVGPMFYEPLRRLRVVLERSSFAITSLDNLSASSVRDRQGQVPDFLEDQVLRIERKWGLPDSPV
jgi:hypothetical protein